MSDLPLKIGIAGLGTVGVGVVRLLHQHSGLIADRAGRPIAITHVAARDATKDRGISVDDFVWVNDPLSMVHEPEIDVILELIGGADGIALALTEAALQAGKSVITANKAMLAHHGYRLASLAETHGAQLLYEASVAAGIPIIKGLREGFAANQITALYGILNGTCNYILTVMRETGRDFDDVLQEAQRLGYAEADPSFDVDGIDAAHKLCILSALAFGHRPDFANLSIAGIRAVSAADIANAGALGFRIKLLGIAKSIGGAISQTVEPCLVPVESIIGSVEGVFNAVFVEGDFIDRSLSFGRGAGERATASAVVADLIDLARGRVTPTFGVRASALQQARFLTTGSLESSYYMHLVVFDRPGVLAEISAILRDHAISVESLLQRGRDPGNPVSIVIMTHETRQDAMSAARAAIDALPSMAKPASIMRVAEF